MVVLVLLAVLAALVIPRADAYLGMSAARRSVAGFETFLGRAAERAETGDTDVIVMIDSAQGRGETRRAGELLFDFEWDPKKARLVAVGKMETSPEERVLLRVGPDGLLPPLRLEIAGKPYAWRPFARMLLAETP